MAEWPPLTCQVMGQGLPLVWLHAFPLSSLMWEAQRRRLGESYQMITPDLPGFGGSPRLAKPSIAGMASSVLALLDRLTVRVPVVLMGLSMGGYVVFELLRQAPERIAAVGLISTRAVADTAKQRTARGKLIERIHAEGWPTVAPTLLPRLLGQTTRTQRPKIVAQVTEQLLANEPAGIIDAVQAMAARVDSTAQVSSIQCPTLIVAGDEDALIPAADTEAMCRAIPNAQLTRIPRAGHLVNLEQPARFSGVVQRFVREVSASASRT